MTIKSFSTYLKEQINDKERLLQESKNVHMEHIEDLVLNEGVNGTKRAIDFLRDIRDMLKGSSSSRVRATVKWDGAPALFCGTDPTDGQFFVAKKGIFNKNPKIYKTPAEVKQDVSAPDLQKKLILALQHLSKAGIKDVVQGDFLFDQSTLKREKIDGETYLTFHPNTIVYAVPEKSEMGKQIKKAKFGIAWHTTYKGRDFQSMSASFGGGIAKKIKARNVWSQDSDYKDVSGTATLTASETNEVNDLLSQIGSLFSKMKPDVLNDLISNDKLLGEVKIFNNQKIRDGQGIKNSKKHAQELKQWISDRYDQKIEEMKTEKGKEKWKEEKDSVMSYFKKHSPLAISRIFDLMVLIVEVKMILIEKMNAASMLKTFIKTKTGFKVTGQEGFVAIDRTGSGAVKLVDRLEFSYANFSPEVLKGWQR